MGKTVVSVSELVEKYRSQIVITNSVLDNEQRTLEVDGKSVISANTNIQDSYTGATNCLDALASSVSNDLLRLDAIKEYFEKADA